ncbi:MAG TPA: DNA (cytosine-5-)-methyltransferase [Candidatus Paceibacterota bacterium]|jgi:DNA-cytosine methyltransferase|nr:MAG: Modification methylase HpaII [Tenericutes bacterium ADurb.Bin024]HOE15372.1 DNA (cytosine-5-)-methyltransferase [Candidatus Paceibacterota bacterium]
MKFKILDLFSGAGGFSCGMDKNKNFETVLGLDFDKNAIETFNNNIKGAYGIVGDITDQEVKKLIIKESKLLGVNMIIGGPPCQGFSLKGKQLGLEDPRNFLFREYIEIVSEIKPEVFVIENVKNLINACNGYFINEIRERFSKLGYIVNYGVLNAKDFGVPQNRERAIIIGSLSRSIPLPKGNSENIITVRDAISDLSYLNSGQGEDVSEYINESKSNYQKKLRGKKLYNHKATNHSKLALEKLKMVPPEGDKSSIPVELHGKQKFLTTWSRLKWDDVSPTIDTRFDTPSNGRNSHPVLHRAITPREAARIQGFDDDFQFFGPKTSICRQIGNAVPPLMAKAIADTIYETYKDKRIEENNYSVYLSDSFVIVKELIKNKLKVNHIITDPPYNISKKNNFSTMSSPRKGVDFGEWDKKFDLFNWITDYVDLLDKNGSIIIFCSYLYISYIIDELQKNNIDVKDVLVWQKSNPMPRNVTRRYVQDMEFAIWGVKKGAKWVFNKPKDVSYLRSIFTTSTVAGLEKTEHPTQKSLKLMRKIIEIHTNKNDLILDPFMGSGSTGVAALDLGRRFIGIENDEKYFKIALERLESKR